MVYCPLDLVDFFCSRIPNNAVSAFGCNISSLGSVPPSISLMAVLSSLKYTVNLRFFPVYESIGQF